MRGPKGKAQLKARAVAIIANVTRYGYDARVKLAEALRAFEAGELYRPADTLARMVRQAEAGDVVEAPGDEISEDWESVGHQTERLIETSIPDWLRDAICTALCAAASRHRVEVWKAFPEALEPDPSYEGVGYSAAALGELFRVSQVTQFEDLFDNSLAAHISTVLKHPDTPRELYDGMRRALATLAEPDAVNEDAAVIAVALAVHKSEEKGADG